MFAVLIMLMSGTVSLASVYFSHREQSRARHELANVRSGIEKHTGDSMVLSPLDQELDSLLQDVFQESHHATMVLALNELSSDAVLARERARALVRGMSRIPFLAGGAGALAIVALGRLESSSLVQAGACLGTGFLCSLLGQFFARRAQRSARALVDVVDTLSRTVEKRWRVGAHGGKGSSGVNDASRSDTLGGGR